MLRLRAYSTLLGLLLAQYAAGQPMQVQHEVSFPGLKQQYVNVRSEFPVAGPTTMLRMPAWIPGSYLIRDFAADIENMRFSDRAGNPRAFTKTAKDAWQVNTGGMQHLVAEYRVHAGELSVNTSWASPEYIVLNPATVFLYNKSSRPLQQALKVHKPPWFEHVLSAMPQDEQGMFMAADFDELVDNPLVIADAPIHAFEDRDQQYRLVNVAATGFWDSEQSASDVQAIVAASNRFWGELPFDRTYWFFNILAERGGGLEHDHSTLIMGHRWQMQDRDDYIKWLSLAAHEYFHAWNVRRLRPQALQHYDLQQEQYSNALWLAEGITSYYDNLLLSRAQLVEPDEYFKRLALDLHVLELTPGRERISLRGASHDAWIRHYKQDANSVNSTVSYYNKGAVLGFVLDTRLRSGSKNRVNLDHVMRQFWQRWKAKAYPEGAFLQIVAELGGEETRDWLEPLLSQSGSLDIDLALAWYGLVLDRHPVNNAARAADEPLEAGMGINWEADVPALVVSSVVHEMGASRAGVLPGDELLAISGERVTRETIEDRMGRLQPGLEVQLLLARHGRIIEVPVILDEARPATYEIMIDEDFGNRHLRRLESWLGQELTVNR
ncbi:MAG: PDZ domain-containing protein [Gammaproteobacteria bacterium]|nr:PDZ domain-containing protein [Gammaproteobacteria bacterium]